MNCWELFKVCGFWKLFYIRLLQMHFLFVLHGIFPFLLWISIWFWLYYLLQFNDFRCQLELRYLDKGRHIILQSWISNAVFPNLKNVTFDACIYECRKKWFGGGNDKLFELSVFLLKNATALKKFVIVSKRRICRECSESCVSQYLSGLAKKLLDSPRSSKKLLIIYQESALDWLE